MSFLYGNYITMTNLSDADKKRIVEQRLSPLYISVHSTNAEIRNKLIGNPHASDILKEIKFLASHKIRMHTQIVLCPGYNDGKSLEKTITDLYKYYPYVSSIAVVPVGITAHRKKALRPVEKDDAVKAIGTIQKLQARFKRKHGDNIVYAADELYIKAEIQFPPLEHYGELPQIENGVGMVPAFLHQARRIKAPRASKKKMFITFTGASFYPYLLKLINKLIKDGIGIEAVSVENAFFGPSVTVTGLLTGRDVIKSLSGIVKKDDVLLIPDVVMREGDEVFLDDISRQDIEDVLGVKAVVIESTPKGLVDAISKEGL
jgi:putative radical SAM enzyme (TIGR03279 family)